MKDRCQTAENNALGSTFCEEFIGEFSFEQHTQSLPGAVQADLYGVGRDAGHVGRLLCVQLFDVAQEEHGPLGFCQAVDNCRTSARVFRRCKSPSLISSYDGETETGMQHQREHDTDVP